MPSIAESGLVSLDFWSKPQDERDEVFASLRAAEGPAFCPVPDEPGFYAITRYEEVAEASRNPQVFSSQPTAVSLVDPPPQVAPYSGSMISIDDPRHARLRRIVSRSFTPRLVQRVTGDVAVLARHIVDELAERGPCDFVEHVAMPMPLQIICSMMGIPESAYDDVIDATNVIIAIGDPDYVGPDGDDRTTVLTEKFSLLHALMADLGRLRRENPADDLVTALTHANVDGEALDDLDLGRFFSLLVVAGNETTRNALSHALCLLTDNPEQRDVLLADLDVRLPAAVEEIVRYSTPVTWMRRTLTRDHELGGHVYRAGDRVILYYTSANRDENVFDDPLAFDVMRSPNPHFGFGAPGPHFCLGAHLARREITVLLRELYTRLPTMHATAPPVRQRTSFINGIKSLTCAF
ncbi:cytochrome P450 [Actinomadura citrea]|uniref:Cytochrome P450 n=1 Tax=Actinomadura citrea TaxID=46158 RepID=A0A7Y9GBA6_9ACTN|nr:cytochrome P450 [Actinomadura citrea]NYE13321.1 cytochrome P450 [Actinomadura citrea]GGU05616.1 linalool 8-monooxygenase [Actinomadura citrea]